MNPLVVSFLQDEISSDKNEMITLLEQKTALLDSKISLEKQEILARQAELHEELQGADALNQVSIADVETKCINKWEIFQKREEAEREAMRRNVDTKINQVYK